MFTARYGLNVTSFPPSASDFPCKYHATNVSVLVFICILLLPEGQTDETWEPSKNHYSSGSYVAWIDFHFFFPFFRGLRPDLCSDRSLSPSRALYNNVNIKIYKLAVLPAVLYGCETWSVTVWQKRKGLRCLRTERLRP